MMMVRLSVNRVKDLKAYHDTCRVVETSWKGYTILMTRVFCIAQYRSRRTSTFDQTTLLSDLANHVHFIARR